jgi:hypothetical protein
VNIGKRAPFTKVEKVAIIEKELGYYVVGTGVHFRFEVLHLHETIRRRGMPFGKSCYTNSKTAAVGV